MLEHTEFVSLKLLETLTYTPIERVQLLAKYRKFQHNRGNRCWGPIESEKPKSWVAAECQIRQWDTLHQATKQPTVMRFLKSDDRHRLPLKLSSTWRIPVFRKHSGLFSTLIIAEHEKTGNKFYALLISPLLPKVFLIDSRALALLNICTNVLNLTLNHLNRLV